MDAISFVLGVRSVQLRSSQLKDLVYRGRRLAKGDENGDGSVNNDAENESVAEEEDQGNGFGEPDAKSAWVLAAFEDSDKKEWIYKRS